jgi:hypothetical protein
MLESRFPEERSEFAAEGTAAHELADLDLQLALGIISAQQHSKRRAEREKSQYYGPQMDACVEQYVEYVLERCAGAQLAKPEQRVDFSHVAPGGFGTVDALAIKEPVAYVTDFKYGKGVRVDAERNPQLMLYGLGALNQYGLAYNIEEVELAVVQPRLEHISAWRVSAAELERWAGEEARPKARLAAKGQGEQAAGPWCRFCRAKPTCKALHRKALEAAKWDFSTPQELSSQELAEAYKQGEQLSMWLGAVRKHIVSLMLSGHQVPGLKLAASKGRRAWADEAGAKAKLEELGFSQNQYLKTQKLKGIGDVSELMSQDDFEKHLTPFIEKKPGPPSIVSQADPKPEYNSAKQDFS